MYNSMCLTQCLIRYIHNDARRVVSTNTASSTDESERLPDDFRQSLVSIRTIECRQLPIAVNTKGVAEGLLCCFSRSSLGSRSLSGSICSLSSLLAGVLLCFLAAAFFSLLATFGLLSLFAALTFALSGFLAAPHSANGYKCDKQNFFHNTNN